MLLRRLTLTTLTIVGIIFLMTNVFIVHSAPPTTYRDSIAIVLRARSVVYNEIIIVACGGNPSACYSNIFGDVTISGSRPATGFFRCARGGIECRLTIPALDIYSAPMPQLTGAETVIERWKRLRGDFEREVRQMVR